MVRRHRDLTIDQVSIPLTQTAVEAAGVYVCLCHGVSSLTFYVESNSIRSMTKTKVSLHLVEIRCDYKAFPEMHSGKTAYGQNGLQSNMTFKKQA